MGDGTPLAPMGNGRPRAAGLEGQISSALAYAHAALDMHGKWCMQGQRLKTGDWDTGSDNPAAPSANC